MIINQFVSLKQNNINMFMITLFVKDIIKNYEVDIYDQDENPLGYQRSPIPTHYRDIAKYFLNTSSIFLPSAIIGAVNKNQIKISNQNTLEIQGKIRIVDGQHRIKGFEYAIGLGAKLGINREKIIQQMQEFQLPVILMEIDKSSPSEKLNEVIAFIDINSKGKKVSTDLAISLRNEMYKTNEDYLLDEIKLQERIATETAQSLTKSADSLWFKAIKHTPSDKGRIISINLFNKSLLPIIKHFIELTPPINNKEVTIISKELESFINETWVAIYKRWPKCFTNTKTFNKDFNIQKGIGVHALHLVLEESLTKIRQEFSNANSPLKDILTKSFIDFHEVLELSTVEEDDWSAGGKFSGYNSASGFNKVKFYLLNGRFPD
ncbi:DGQHR domain-containing protein [Neobacillus bataviensis]|uniref:DGQHR domain-containing protein n=1 Tax=Neobacillus bataviensis TaxID=220685 RepID=A0A561CLV1_9BACI|nr:DGQHR domain-containing protein [Neobacillus bataviensis]TWD92205.1 DGQHR domain-containing protein [Neobacillus bataviensis]